MYFKHSGRFSVGGLAIAIATGAAASLPLAYAYAWGTPLITDERFAVLATFAFAGLVGVAAGYGLVWGKGRNQSVALAVSGTVSVLALYLSWAMWVERVLATQQVARSWSDLASHPTALWSVIRLINEYGTWSLGSGPATSGWQLWGIWLTEAAIMISIAMSVGYAIWNHHPFCETCDCWCRHGANISLAAPRNAAQLKRQLEANDLSPLGSLGPHNNSADHLRVDLDTCQQCRVFHTLSLTHITIRRNKLGRTAISKKKIMQHLLLKPGQAEELRQLSERTQSLKGNVAKTNSVEAGNSQGVWQKTFDSLRDTARALF